MNGDTIKRYGAVKIIVRASSHLEYPVRQIIWANLGMTSRLSQIVEARRNPPLLINLPLSTPALSPTSSLPQPQELLLCVFALSSLATSAFASVLSNPVRKKPTHFCRHSVHLPLRIPHLGLGLGNDGVSGDKQLILPGGFAILTR